MGLGEQLDPKGEYMFIGSDNNSPCAFNSGVVGGLPPGSYCWNHSGFDGISTAKVGLNYLFGWRLAVCSVLGALKAPPN